MTLLAHLETILFPTVLLLTVLVEEFDWNCVVPFTLYIFLPKRVFAPFKIFVGAFLVSPLFRDMCLRYINGTLVCITCYAKIYGDPVDPIISP